jgi:ubiquinone/menaquinone biosynthesis C-methylase UbiE
MNEKTKQMWNNRSDDYFKDINDSLNIIKQNPEKGFPTEVFEMIRNEFHSLENKNVLVASSGDNIGAFSFYLLGANVTSTDISENQLKNAAKIADANNWKIKYICTDSMELKGIESEKYDIVYTSNGVHIWISDLVTMYGNFFRVLAKNGFYIFFETHPIIRPFDDNGTDIKIIRPYGITGPVDDPPQYLWRIEDFLRSLIKAGFIIKDYRDIKARPADIMAHNWFYKTCEELENDNADKFDWKKNPWAALPQWIGCKTKKE